MTSKSLCRAWVFMLLETPIQRGRISTGARLRPSLWQNWGIAWNDRRMVRFAMEWFPHMHTEPPATALARSQQWLRTVTNRDLLLWQATLSPQPVSVNDLAKGSEILAGANVAGSGGQLVAVRGRANR